MPNGKVAPYPLDDLAELLLRFEEDRSEWGQRQGQAVQVAVAPDGPGVAPAQVALPAAAVHRRIAVQQLAPVARHRRADLIVMPRHWREVERGHDQIVRPRATPQH